MRILWIYLFLLVSLSAQSLIAQELPRFSLVSSYLGEDIIANMVEPEREVGKAKVEYLHTEQSRNPYKISVENGLLYYQGDILSTPVKYGKRAVVINNNIRSIFVITTNLEMFFYQSPKPNIFHHSSFIAGDDVLAAGEMIVFDGQIASMNYYSGHYLPTIESYLSIQHYLGTHNYNGYIPTLEEFKEYMGGLLKRAPRIIEALNERDDPLIPKRDCSKLLQ